MEFHSSVLFVADIKRSRDFYSGLMGLTLKHDFGNNLSFHQGLSLWQMNGQHEIAQVNMGKEKVGSRFELYFETENMDDVLHKLKLWKPVEMHPVKMESWGQKTIRFYDPDGHLIEVGESLSGFTTRMYREGMNEEEISKVTGIPAADLKNLINRV